MGPDKPVKKARTAFVRADKYVTGMSFNEAVKAGAIVVSHEPDTVVGEPRPEVALFTTLECHRATAERPKENRPPWAGRKPWWQR